MWSQSVDCVCKHGGYAQMKACIDTFRDLCHTYVFAKMLAHCLLHYPLHFLLHYPLKPVTLFHALTIMIIYDTYAFLCRIVRELKKKQDDDTRNDAEKKAKLKQASLAAQEQNRSMVEAKAKRVAAEKAENDALARRLDEEIQVLRSQEEMKKEAKKAQMIKTRTQLDQQIAQVNARRSVEKAALSEREVQLNKSFLNKVKEDPTMQNKLQAKLHPATRRYQLPKIA